jgi:phosphatidylglycerophosphatase A
LKEIVRKLIESRGVTIDDIAHLVFELQKKYLPITMEMCVKVTESVLEKREVQNAILTGICLDIAAEKGFVEEPLKSMLLTDEPLYGIDEILALSIINIYGSIAFTNYGYIDKTKMGIIAELNKQKDRQCNTFLDDLVAAIASAACSKLAHNFVRKQARQQKDKKEQDLLR